MTDPWVIVESGVIAGVLLALAWWSLPAHRRRRARVAAEVRRAFRRDDS